MDIYRTGIQPLLFSRLKVDPEWAHQRSLALLGRVAQHQTQFPFSRIEHLLKSAFSINATRLNQTIWGLSFQNPFGLAAGFDKDGVAAGIWHSFGFGFAELGTVTLHPQPGNPRPRLFRLSQDRAVLNRMGFNNQGAAALAKRLSQPSISLSLPIGINLGKSKITPLDAAARDYLASFRQLKAVGDYFVVNVSSPNTPGLRSLQDAAQLGQILEALQTENQGDKPILVKIAPDLEWEAIADILDLAKIYQLAGIIATNTTIRRDGLSTSILSRTGKPVTEEAGGISGAPLKQRSTEVIRWIYQQTQGQLPIIGVGGIFTAEDAWEKITAGACLIQTYTGWIYQGPGMVKQILEGLLTRLDQAGFNSISEAVGCQSSK